MQLIRTLELETDVWNEVRTARLDATEWLKDIQYNFVYDLTASPRKLILIQLPHCESESQCMLLVHCISKEGTSHHLWCYRLLKFLIIF